MSSPKEDPTGLSQGTKSHLDYEISVPQAGTYALRAQVVTMNDKQRLKLAVNDEASAMVVEMPFTCGKWQDSEPAELALKHGANVLRFWRDDPPQQGVAVKSFTFTPVK